MNQMDVLRKPTNTSPKSLQRTPQKHKSDVACVSLKKKIDNQDKN